MTDKKNQRVIGISAVPVEHEYILMPLSQWQVMLNKIAARIEFVLEETSDTDLFIVVEDDGSFRIAMVGDNTDRDLRAKWNDLDPESENFTGKLIE